MYWFRGGPSCSVCQFPVVEFGRSARPPAHVPASPPTDTLPLPSRLPCRYGDFVVLAQHDHISVCKPWDTSDPAYARLLAFLHARVRALRLARADAAGRLDHMEASVL